MRRAESVDDLAPLSASPPWMEKDFVVRADVEFRLRAASRLEESAHPWHPRAIASFTSAIWSPLLESFDVAVTGTPIEWRHPYLDLRVLNFLLSVPPIPWARRKLLVRRAMQGILPEAVLSREKSPLVEDPIVRMLQRHPFSKLALCKSALDLIDDSKLPIDPQSARDTHDLLKIRILDFWLRTNQRHSAERSNKMNQRD